MAQQTPPAGPDPAAADEVILQVGHLGLGDMPRVGDWAGIQLIITDRSAQVREIAVRFELPDADGDTALYQRVVASTPGVRQSVWLYARLPLDIEGTGVLNFSAYEVRARDTAAARDAPASPATRGDLGRKLGALRQPLNRLLSSTSGAIAIVGRGTNLEEFATRTAAFNWSPKGHELKELLEGLRPADLPDRWLGYAGLTAIVWTASGAEGDPTQLTEGQASAIREWVQRGGHLVIVLPSVGQTWINASNPLSDIMPAVTVERREGVNYAELQRLLRKDPLKDRVEVFPPEGVVNIIEPTKAARTGEAMRILSGPDGQSLVTRRLIGTGAVTLIGLDLTSKALQTTGGADPEVLWHRILGTRGELLSTTQLAANATAQPSQRLRFESREAVALDRRFEQQIDKKGAAAAGLLLAFVVFLAYWLIAGPVGFAVLKRRKLSQWAWVGFVTACAAFTAFAWGGANLIKPRKIDGTHLTFLDHVYGQTIQRARSWMSILLPTYGTMTVSIDREQDSDRFHNALTAWTGPTDGLGGSQRFPDARAYTIESRRPDTIAIPSRSTVKTVQADWAGGPRWKMPIPLSNEDAPRLRELEISRGGRQWELTGKLQHQLPGPLSDCTLVIVRGQLKLGQNPAGGLMANAEAIRFRGDWKPGDVLDLAMLTDTSDPAATKMESASNYFDIRLPGGRDQNDRADRTLSTSEITERLNALAFFSVLNPPTNLTDADARSAAPLYRRESTHGWDLGRWFTQPCIIIVGHLQNAECPIPMSVDGESMPTTGRTVVRWVYPLPEAPPLEVPRTR